MGSRSPMGIGNFCAIFVKYRAFRRELCKNGGTDRFAGWVVDAGGPKEAHVQSYLPRGRAHCCYLVNTIESSVCGGDAALCQITLTTC